MKSVVGDVDRVGDAPGPGAARSSRARAGVGAPAGGGEGEPEDLGREAGAAHAEQHDVGDAVRAHLVGEGLDRRAGPRAACPRSSASRAGPRAPACPGGAQSVPSLRQTRRTTSSARRPWRAARRPAARARRGRSASNVGGPAGDDRLALGLDAGQQLVHRHDEGLDAVAQQLVGDVVEVDARRAQRVEVRRGVERGGRAAHLGLAGRGLQRRQAASCSPCRARRGRRRTASPGTRGS